MNLETDAPQGGTEGVVAPSETVETPSAATTEQDTGTETPESPTDGGADTEEPKRVPWFQKRIDEVTRQKYDAQREAAYWRGLAEGGGQQAQPQRQSTEGPPREDQFATLEEYDDARVAYIVEQRLNQERLNQQRQTVARTYEERAAKIRETKADFDAVVSDPSLRITPLMAEVIRESELGPQVAYHLGTNRSEADRIAGLPPHMQAAALGRIEAALSAPPPAPSPKPIPPTPPQTVAGLSAGMNKSPEEMTMAEYKAWRESQS